MLAVGTAASPAGTVLSPCSSLPGPHPLVLTPVVPWDVNRPGVMAQNSFGLAWILLLSVVEAFSGFSCGHRVCSRFG